MIDSECLLVENTNGVFYSILIVSCFTNKHKKTCRQISRHALSLRKGKVYLRMLMQCRERLLYHLFS